MFSSIFMMKNCRKKILKKNFHFDEVTTEIWEKMMKFKFSNAWNCFWVQFLGQKLKNPERYSSSRATLPTQSSRNINISYPHEILSHRASYQNEISLKNKKYNVFCESKIKVTNRFANVTRRDATRRENLLPEILFWNTIFRISWTRRDATWVNLNDENWLTMTALPNDISITQSGRNNRYPVPRMRTRKNNNAYAEHVFCM